MSSRATRRRTAPRWRRGSMLGSRAISRPTTPGCTRPSGRIERRAKPLFATSYRCLFRDASLSRPVWAGRAALIRHGDHLSSVAGEPKEHRIVDIVLTESLSLVVRWLHLVAGIAWIGTSFYFIHLDLGLTHRAGL